MVSQDDDHVGVSFYSSQLIRFSGIINPEGVSVRSNVPVEIVELQNNIEHVLANGVTSSDGSYSITGRFQYTGSVFVFARCGDDVSGQWAVDVIDDRQATSLTFSSSSNTIIKSSGSVTLSGVLSAGSGFSVKIYDENDTLIDTLTTGTNGDFSKVISNSGTVGVKEYYAVFEGDSVYHDCTSSTVPVYTITTDYVELTVTGQRIQQIHSGNLLVNANNEHIVIDYGDNTLKVYDGSYTHDYSSSGTYNVKIYNVTGFGSQCFANLDNSSIGGNLTAVTLPEGITTIGNYCFRNTGLTSLIVPSTVTSIGSYAFQSGFTEITLPWTVASNIVQYERIWNYPGWASGFKFLIPAGTTSLYTSKSYPSSLLREDVDFDGIELTSDKSILSAHDQESATLTAQLTYEDSPVAVSGETVTFEVRKSSDDSLVETLTADTNSSGVATVSYLGKASGDLYIKAIVDSVIFSETYTVEDCLYWNSAEVTRTSTNGSTIYDNTMSVDLPSKCEISFDVSSSNVSGGSERRWFLLPKSQFSTSTTQPTYGLFFQIASSQGIFSGRENNANMPGVNTGSVSNNTVYNIKYIRDGTTLQEYINDVLVNTRTVTFFDNYTDWTFSMIRWSATGTTNLRNVKIKAL